MAEASHIVGHSAADHADHGHLPGPLSNGKLIVWLFLSTEIMFFAGLIGTYIVLRFGAPTWPLPREVHLSEPIGAFNTFVLICSSVSVVLCLEAARANQVVAAKGWLIVTFALGSVFLGVKMYEYNAKFSHGIYPWRPHSLIYEKADLNYAAAVRIRLEALESELKTRESELKAGLDEATADENPAVKAVHEQLEIVGREKTFEQEAETKAATDTDPAQAHERLNALAARIMPLPLHHGEESGLNHEYSWLRLPIAAISKPSRAAAPSILTIFYF